jgi:hypothetical protein
VPFRREFSYPAEGRSLWPVMLVALVVAALGGAGALAQEAGGAAGPRLDAPTGPQPADPKGGSGNAGPPIEDASGDPARLATIGEPRAQAMIKLLQQEIVDGLAKRGITENFRRFERYAASRLAATAGPRTGSELTGNCRLSWYEHLLRNPLVVPAEAEKFTRQLFVAASGDHNGLAELIALASEKLDLGTRTPREFPEVQSPEQALDVLRQALVEARAAHAAALAPLTKSEIRELQTGLYPILTEQNRVGHTLVNRTGGRRLCDLLEKMDRRALCDAAEALAPLVDPVLLEHLAALPEDGSVAVEGVTGTVVRRIDTPAGAILIGGRGPNTYHLDKMKDVSAVVDLGGDDTYLEGTVSLDRPVLVLIDLGGNDTYRGASPGVQGGAILGVSMLVNLSGNDTYQARDVAQGSAVGGVGILVDFEGDDQYVGIRRVQGQAFGGLGILIDRDGDDRYRGAMWTQGFGGPLGLGLLADLDGRDHYYTGGLYLDSYPETPGYEGWGQGVGAGLRQVAGGGIGVILDGGGDDVYEFDYLAHGGGYWCGVGLARDFAGNDQRLGATRVAFDGKPRTERRFQRFGSGWGCHYAVGVLIDDAGDDVYGGTIMGTGFAWDCAVGYLLDFGGNDRYEAAGGGTQGNGAQAGLGVLFDYDGDDVYLGYGQGHASPSISYHRLPECGGNFSFLVDYGGEDKYGCGAKNNSYVERGSRGGFLIDRPSRREIQTTAEKAENAAPSGS